MTLNEWQARARAFTRSSQLLLQGGEHSSAYHLCGLAVECALKAKIARGFRANDFPERKFVEKIHTHNLNELLKLAQLTQALDLEEQTSATFRAYWNTVRGWDIESRYKVWTPAEANGMVETATKRGTGVLAWIRQHW